MRTKRLLLLPLVLAFGPAPCAAQQRPHSQIQIELRPEVLARRGDVRLGEVAYLRTRDLPTIQRLAALSLGQAPGPGQDAIVRREAVARWVRSQLGIGLDRVTWSGPEESHVRTMAQQIPAERIEQAAAAALGQWLSRRSSRYQADPLGTRDLDLPAGTVGLSVRPLATNARPAQRMSVWVDVQVDGRFVRAVPVTFAVEAYRDAWVAPEPIAQGVRLSTARLEKREVRITGHGGISASPISFSHGDGAFGWRTIQKLEAGEALTSRNAAPVSLIGRGEWVSLLLKSGTVELESRAQALQNGDLGQTVQVRPAHAARPVMARVIAPGRAEALL